MTRPVENPRSHQTANIKKDAEKRLVSLDLLLARSKAAKEMQKRDFKRVKSYKGDGSDAEKLLQATRKTIKRAKKERDGIIAKLLKAEDAAMKKNSGRTTALGH
jgi:hypothetical protein